MVNHMRHTSGHTRNRRSHHALKATGFVLCASCGNPKQKHLACGNCGKYKAHTAIDIQGRADRKEAKRKEKMTAGR